MDVVLFKECNELLIILQVSNVSGVKLLSLCVVVGLIGSSAGSSPGVSWLASKSDTRHPMASSFLPISCSFNLSVVKDE